MQQIVTKLPTAAPIQEFYPFSMTDHQSRMYYTVKLFVGRFRQPMNFIVDTGSSDFLIHGPGCNGCPGVPFVWSRSHSFHNNGHRVEENNFHGVEVTDEIAMNAEEKHIEAIEMVMLSNVRGNLMTKGKADGVIGFAPRRISNNGNRERRHLPFMTQIYKKGLVKRNMFAMHFREEENLLWIGGYPKAYLNQTFTDMF